MINSSFGTWKWRKREYRRAVFIPLLTLLVSLNWYVIHIYVHHKAGMSTIFFNISLAYAGLFIFWGVRMFIFATPYELWNSSLRPGALPKSVWVFRALKVARFLMISAAVSFFVGAWFLGVGVDNSDTGSEPADRLFNTAGDVNLTADNSIRCDAIMTFALVLHSVAAVLAFDQLGGRATTVYGSISLAVIGWLSFFVSWLGIYVHRSCSLIISMCGLGCPVRVCAVP
jgi:hypothetical protein